MIQSAGASGSVKGGSSSLARADDTDVYCTDSTTRKLTCQTVLVPKVCLCDRQRERERERERGRERERKRERERERDRGMKKERGKKDFKQEEKWTEIW